MHQDKDWTREELRQVRTVRYGNATGKVICSNYCVCVEWDTHTGQHTYDGFGKLLQEGAIVDDSNANRRKNGRQQRWILTEYSVGILANGRCDVGARG